MKQYIALKASAGSGKTFALTVRYISLLLLDAKPKEILSLTFTNKAANEMSERIFKTLSTLGDDEAYLSAIIEQSSLSKEKILGKKNNLLKQYSKAELSIFTIDKFVNKILREFSGYIGISDDFEIHEDDIEHLSLKFLQSLELKEFDKLINFSLHEGKKFTSIFDLFKNLLAKNEVFDIVPIDSSLISLQKAEVLKQAYKIKEHILNFPSCSNAAIKAVDFDCFSSLLVRGKSWLAKSHMSEYSYFKKASSDEIEIVFSSLKSLINDYYKLRSAHSLSSLYELFLMFKNYKNSYNKNKNYLEFNDISNLVFELLHEKIEKDFLYFRLDSTYKHILIDEFQDTSLLQFNILKPIIDEILSGSKEEFKSFFYVGDTKQSIYRFRGGKRELFDYVSTKYPQVEVEQLNTNYRSSQKIVSFVNDTFLNVHNYEYIKQESIHRNGYIEVLEDEALSEDEKFKNVALKISNLFKEGINANNIAILTYTNDDVLTLFSYLQQKFPSIKISTEMTSRIINQANVKALINLIKYLYYKEEIYKENFNAILGKKLLSVCDYYIDLHENSIQTIIKKLASHFNIIDDNVIRFIEISSKFENIVDFVYEIDKLEDSILNSEQNGLQILTIFKSKGLEFDTVLLLDRIKRKNSDKSSLLFEYEKVFLKNVFYKISGLEHFDERYKEAKEKEKLLEREDELNILYVAMTRARNNLIIFKKQKASVFDLLNLSKCKIGDIYISSDIKNTLVKKTKVLYQALDLGVQEKSIKKQKDLDHTLHSKYFGLASHYCLEMMNSFDNKSLNYALRITKSRFSSYLKQNDFNDMKNRIEYLLANDFFTKLINKSEFLSEQALIYKDELKIIDLLLKCENKYIIFDYKTTISEHEEHITQVRYYKKAIKEIFKTEEVMAFVIYLKTDKVYFKEI